jgi:hypothetical protein
MGYVGLNLLNEIFISSIQERRADAYANSHATIEELEGGIKFFRMSQEKISKIWAEATDLSSQTRFFLRYIRYIIRNCVLTGHPLDSTRIAAIEDEIARRRKTTQLLLV